MSFFLKEPFAYDHGNNAARDIPAGTTSYLYDDRQIVEERVEANPDDWDQLYFWGRYVDELLWVSRHGYLARVASDLLYRSAATLQQDNAFNQAYDTDAYGNTLCYSGPGTGGNWWADNAVRTNNPVNPYIFTGREFDPETQIYYYRARYYAPEWGRFLSRDGLKSAEVKQGPNLYRYAYGSPINYLDPSGSVGISAPKTPSPGNAAWTSIIFMATVAADALFEKCPQISDCKDDCEACCSGALVAATALATAALIEAGEGCTGFLILPPPFGELAWAACLISVGAAYKIAATNSGHRANHDKNGSIAAPRYSRSAIKGNGFGFSFERSNTRAHLHPVLVLDNLSKANRARLKNRTRPPAKRVRNATALALSLP